jgi:hypothetical protein
MRLSGAAQRIDYEERIGADRSELEQHDAGETVADHLGLNPNRIARMRTDTP